MEKKKIFAVIIMTFIIAFIGSAIALTVEQQVTVNVVAGIINLISPINGNIYQVNTIPLTFNVVTNNPVKDIWMFDNNNQKILCTKCRNYSNNVHFSEGNHLVVIKVNFLNGDAIQKNVSFVVDSQSEIYLNSSSGVLMKASAKDIVDYLFNVDFTLIHKNELAPEDSCSVRGNLGNSIVNGQDYGNMIRLNFYSVSSISQGQGEVFVQNNRKRFDFQFRTSSIIENSDNFLKLNVKDNNTTAVLVFDKINNKVSITGNNFSFENINVTFIEGCSSRKQMFYFLQNNGRLETPRTIQQVRQILNDNPIFLERHPNLGFLFSRFWMIIKLLGTF